MSRRTILHHWVGTTRRFLRNARRALHGYRNGPELVAALLAGRREVTGVLVDGTAITAPEVGTLLATVEEVIDRRAYTPEDLPISSGDVVVDIGAHVGTFALWAARLGARAVHAYEPMPENVRLLQHNVERNRADAVVVHHAAIGDRDGTATMHAGIYSVGGMLAGIGESSGRSVEVPMVSLETIMRENGLERIDFLKVDCEGAEGRMLRSASPELLARIGAMSIEYHDGWSELDHDRIAELLARHGFQVRVAPERDPRFGYVYARRPEAPGRFP